MTIFILRKKTIISIFIFLTIILSSFNYLKNNNVIAIELSENNIINNNTLEKISNLVYGTEKIAYLTFDDGPNPNITPKVLDILEEENIKASFFVIGKSVKSYPNIVKRAYDDGHFIANHGYSHDNSLLYKTKENFINEIKKTDIEIGKALDIKNYCSHVFRFPNGLMAPAYKEQKTNALKLLSDLNYSYIDWNCLNKDSEKHYSSRELLENLKASCDGKTTLVILMHDTKDVSNSSEILRESIQFLKNKGYTFKNFYDVI